MLYYLFFLNWLISHNLQLMFKSSSLVQNITYLTDSVNKNFHHLSIKRQELVPSPF
uniref:Uncharacterized protein n=1 Tax=Setaria viridis TaxID=4556 RepID=A0A4U6U3H4_SETVI|nr:hypothetical protein SEVIR_6G038066v2 [Setaria viridis]